ncbi:MAG: hypothetical protein NTV29_12550 [Planctomycetota bacterium]|nr:hypothetical protein [Planctomycetota bacterium]
MLVLSETVLVLVIESRLARIVAKLTRMAMKFDGVSESSSEYNSAVDYEHEHRPPRRTVLVHAEEPKNMAQVSRACCRSLTYNVRFVDFPSVSQVTTAPGIADP